MDLGINIYGVKIYSHSIMKKHPCIASYSCEVAQTKRLREDGYVGMLNHSFAYLFPHRQNKQFSFSTDYQFGGDRNECGDVCVSEFLKMNDEKLLSYNSVWYIREDGDCEA